MRWTQKIGRFAVFVDLAHVSCFDFYGLGWALCFAGQALDAILFSSGVRFLFRGRMPRSVSPVKQCHGADFYADAVSGADFPVNCNVGSMDAKLLRRLYRSPYIMAVVLVNYLAFLLKIGIYWQNCFTQA